MYYAGLRPEEAINLGRDNVILPPHDRGDDDDWGELHIGSATPDAGSEWTDDGSTRERRQLKQRAEGDSRIVPTHPELSERDSTRSWLARIGHVFWHDHGHSHSDTDSSRLRPVVDLGAVVDVEDVDDAAVPIDPVDDPIGAATGAMTAR